MKLKPYKNNMNGLELKGGTIILFSYETPVAAFLPGMGVIRTKTKYSTTTTRHINQWIRDNMSPNVTVKEVEQSVIDNLSGFAQERKK